jgi:hypothetical protein
MLEISKLFSLVKAQEESIEKSLQTQGHLLSPPTKTAIKTRQERHGLDEEKLIAALRQANNGKEYGRWVHEEQLHQELLRELLERSQIRTITTIKDL